MKNLNLSVLSTILLLSSCSHTPDTASKKGLISLQESKWMDQTDYVRYVNFFTRAPSNTGSIYNIIGDCNGYPMVDVKTAPGFCVGQVYNGDGMRKPRMAAPINANQVVVTDQGSWEPYDGKIILLSFENGTSSIKNIFTNKSFASNDLRREIINKPHQITKYTDGLFYVGSATALFRFNPLAENPIDTIETLVSGLPAEGLHPLKSFVFDEEGSLYINVGAATNVCHKSGLGGIFGGKKKSCEEGEDLQIGQAQIRRYKKTTDGKFTKTFEVYAKGLRNSVAMVWDPKKKVIIQGENSRDAIDKMDSKIKNEDYPHDEINIITKDKHYGWPYCYDNNENSPEWKNINCSAYQKPHMFLPAHAAPLNFTYYQGSMFPEWYKGRLLAAFHGYESKGHRIVAFKRDQAGLPTGIPQSVVYGWENKGEQKFGSPVSLTELPDGSMLIVEDTNQKILRLFYDPSLGDGTPVQEIEKPAIDVNPNRANDEETRKLKLLRKIAAGDVPPFTMFQTKVIDKTCFMCHGGENAPGIQLLRYDDEGNEAKIIKMNKVKTIYSMVKGESGFPTMPPQGFDGLAEKAEAVNLLKLWIEHIPQI
ncbi:MAG: PQQ-dependent sugar dehydrogenase [Rhizobacter sp.]|nr:PQQ-dependent sugar dehydrogenase [Bacteriovorax sp.]